MKSKKAKKGNLPKAVGVQLPAIQGAARRLTELADSLDVPRDVLPSEEEIESAWSSIPSIMNRIPPDLRQEDLVRMCVAVGSGLFDSAINYVWNCSINRLREKVRNFGLNVVRQLVDSREFDEGKLLDMRDGELLRLCLRINLITEDGHFFLEQCRVVRNNFSAAHPPIGKIDNHEFTVFANRCAKYALSDEINPIGLDISEFIDVLKESKFSDEQVATWSERIDRTHEAQRELVFGTLHGIYCDPDGSEAARLNSLAICKEFSDQFSPNTLSDLVDRHQEYRAKDDEKRHKASQLYFQELGIFDLLSKAERHNVISSACDRLMIVHQGFDNFYNEPPFAERLATLSAQGRVPDSSKRKFVITVVTCAVGNPYGVSREAWPFYREMIQNFSRKEVDILLSIPSSQSTVGRLVSQGGRCGKQFKLIVSLLDESSVPAKAQSMYRRWR